MKKLPLFLSVAILFIANNSAKANSSIPSAEITSCHATWNLAGRGLSLGYAQDEIVKEGNKLTAISKFKPTGLVSTLGMDPVERVYIGVEHTKAVERREARFGKKVEINRWTSQNGKDWKRTINGENDKQANIDDSLLTIDSTIFPYLLKLNMIDLNTRSMSVNVLTKGDPYSATLTLTSIDAPGPIHYKLTFTSPKNNGYVFLKENKDPVSFEFIDENGKLTAIAQEFSCQ